MAKLFNWFRRKKQSSGSIGSQFKQQAPKTKTEVQRLVKKAESGRNYNRVASQVRAPYTPMSDKNRNDYSQFKQFYSKTKEQRKKESENVNQKLSEAKGKLAKSAAKTLTENKNKPKEKPHKASTNEKEILSRNASQSAYSGRRAFSAPTLQDSGVKARMKNNEAYRKLVDAGLWEKGIYGTMNRPVSDEEMAFRKKYGYGKKYAQHINEMAQDEGKVYDRTVNVRYSNRDTTPVEQRHLEGRPISGGRAFMGAEEAFQPKSYEKILQQQYGYENPYGKNGLDEEAMNEARESYSYGAGNMAAQLAQFGATVPLAAPLEAARLAKAGIGVTKAGKALKGADTVRKAGRAAWIRASSQSAVAAPINLMDALKQDSAEDIVKKFAYNQVLDLAFSGLFEVPMLRRNYHYGKAMEKINAANAAKSLTEARALRQDAINELKKLDEKTIKATKDYIYKYGTRNTLERGADLVARDVSMGATENAAKNIAKKETGRTTDQIIDEYIDEVGADKLLNEIDVPENVGWHAGDLGKAENYWRIMSGDRSTGHFGTGTYFTSNEDALINSGYKNRPRQKASFDGYNLYKPKNEAQGVRVHDDLYELNYGIGDYISNMKAAENPERYSDLIYRLTDENIPYTKENLAALEKEAQAAMGGRDFADFKQRYAFNGSLYDRPEIFYADLQDTLREALEVGGVRRHINESLKIIDRLSENLGKSRDEIVDALEKTWETVSKYPDLSTQASHEVDSISTVFMKNLGFDGVDVRGIKGLDNTRYGSVIYDLKKPDEVPGRATKKTPEPKYFKEENKEADEFINKKAEAKKTAELKQEAKKSQKTVSEIEEESVVAQGKAPKTPGTYTVGDTTYKVSRKGKGKGNIKWIVKDNKGNLVAEAKTRQGAIQKAWENSGKEAAERARIKAGEIPAGKPKAALLKDEAGNDIPGYRYRTGKKVYDIYKVGKGKKSQWIVRDTSGKQVGRARTRTEAIEDIEAYYRFNRRPVADEEIKAIENETKKVYGRYHTNDPNPEIPTKELIKRAREISDNKVYKASRTPIRDVHNQKISKAFDTSLDRELLNEESVEQMRRNAVTGKYNTGNIPMKEARELAQKHWKENPAAEAQRLRESLDGMISDPKHNLPETYYNDEDWTFHANEAHKYYKHIEDTATDPVIKQDATDALAKIFEAQSIVNGSQGGTKLRMYQEYLKLSGLSRTRVIERQLAKINKRFAKQLKKAGREPLEIDNIFVSDEDKALLKRLIESNDPLENAKAWKDVSDRIWEEVPASFREKADAWRMTAMLMNPKTHLRNILGNTLFRPVVLFKDLLATPMEKAAIKAGYMEKDDATKAIYNKWSEKNKPYIEAAQSVRERYWPSIKGEAKFFERGGGLMERPTGENIWMAGRAIRDENGKIVGYRGNPVANGFRRFGDWAQKKNANVLELEDEGFLFIPGIKSKFDDSYIKILKARGWNPANMTEEQVEDAVEAATDEALRAVYRDNSKLATWVNKMKNTAPSDSMVRKSFGWALDTVFPFVKTPWNIVRRAGDYSPLGLAKSSAKLAKAMYEHDSKAVAKEIDRLSAGLTGSGLFALGVWLGNKDGLNINAKLAERNEGAYLKDLGFQNYALNLMGEDGWSVTLDWLVPGSIPIFMGVETANAMKGRFSLEKILSVMSKAIDPAMELSVLQGLSNAIDIMQSDSNSKGEAATSFLVNEMMNYGSQFIPTASGQLARFIDPVRRDTYTTTADTDLGKAYQQWTNKTKAKIPWLSKTLQPYVDVYGREQYGASNPLLRALDVAANPAYVKQKNITKVDKEIMRMNEKYPDDPVTPNVRLPGNSVGFDDRTIKLSAEEITTYKKEKGKYQLKGLSELIDSPEYQNASDKDKRKMIKDVESEAATYGKNKALIQHGEDPWEVWTDGFDKGSKKKDYQAAKDAGFEPEEYYNYANNVWHEWDTNGNGSLNKYEISSNLDKLDLTSEQKWVLFHINSTSKYNPYVNGVTVANLPDNSRDGKKSSGSGKSSGGGKSYRRYGSRKRSGGSSSKNTMTDTEKAFAKMHSAEAMRKAASGSSVTQSAQGLTSAQRKALMKMMLRSLQQ